ncbi:MAG: prepilin-type N-terminal cleavage/methylation domain-containing protein [Longicatena sp.]
MINKLIKGKKGFTLMEIIVVLVIMGILLAIAIPSILGYVKKAEDAKYLASARGANVEATAYMEEYMLKNPDQDFDKTIEHFVSIFRCQKIGTSSDIFGPMKNDLIDVEFPNDHMIYSMDYDFDGKSALTGWGYDKSNPKTKGHSITKATITLQSKESAYKAIVTIFNDTSYIWNDFFEAGQAADKGDKTAPARLRS